LDRLAVEEYIKVAELFLNAGDYLEASNAGVQGLTLAGGPDQAPPRLLKAVTQALFLVADSDAAVPLIDDVSTRFPDWSLTPVLAARRAISIGEFEKAHQWVNQGVNADPHNPLARAALAEWDMAAGDKDEGRRIAGTIMSETDQDWLRAFLSGLLSGGG
jgi:hypothetical protein